MAEGYVHNIDPVLADVAGVHLWWYGLGFALGAAGDDNLAPTGNASG